MYQETKPAARIYCDACGQRDDDARECGSARCFRYTCATCDAKNPALYALNACAGCAPEVAAIALASAAPASFAQQRIAAARAVQATRIIEWTDNSWLGKADGPVTVRRVA